MQIGTAASRGALVHALAKLPVFGGAPVGVLRGEVRPAKRLRRSVEPTRRAWPPEIAQRFLASLDAVQSVVDDRILRALFRAVAATVRTNFLPPPSLAVRRRQIDRCVAIKIESATAPHLPRPHPLYEIYVHAPHVEGIHLRAGGLPAAAFA